MTTTVFCPVLRQTTLTTSSICAASSRVGVTTRAKGPKGLASGSLSRESSMGASVRFEAGFFLRRRLRLGFVGESPCVSGADLVWGAASAFAFVSSAGASPPSAFL